MVTISYRRSVIWVLKRVRAHFITGIFVMVPIVITILILVWLFNTIDNILQPAIVAIWHRRFPGVGFGVTIILIYIVGVLTSNLIGKRFLVYAESLVARVPFIRPIYQVLKQLTETFSRTNNNKFLEVVFAEFPSKGMRAIGFVTNEMQDAQTGEKLFSVYIPLAPNPAGGFLQLMRESELVRTKIPVDEAIKMVISMGSVSPRNLG